MAEAASKSSSSPLSGLKGNSGIGAFLIAICIATGIWILNALSLNHQTEVEFVISAKTDQQAKTGLDGKKISVSISGRGFDLLRFTLGTSHPVIELNHLENGFRTHSGIRSFDLIADFLAPYGKELTIEQISPEWLPIEGAAVYLRRVAVKPSLSLMFSPRFIQRGPAVCVPDSIWLSSVSPIPDTLKAINTYTVMRRDVHNDVFTTIEINRDGLTDISIDTASVWVYVPVEQSTECMLKLPVSYEGHDKNAVRFIPETVTLTCNVPVSMFQYTNASRFRLTATIPDAGNKAIVYVKRAPSWAERVLIQSGTIEYYFK